jgi:Ca2+-binding RTX toxin-like protein
LYAGAVGDLSGRAIRAQAFSNVGLKLGDEILANTTTQGHQVASNIITLSSGDVVVTWADNPSLDNALGSYDVHAQRFAVQTGPQTAAQLFGDHKLASLSDFALAAYRLQSWEPTAPETNDPASASADPAFLREVGSNLWRPLQVADLPSLAVPGAGDGTHFRTGLRDGYYTNANAAALVARSADAMIISFRGTNDNGSSGFLDKLSILAGFGTPDEDHWFNLLGLEQGMGDHYALFAGLIAALDAYIANPANGVSRVYVTGHSLGAAMVNAYMDAHANSASVTYEAVTFADPGYFTIDFDSRITNFLNDTDLINVGDFVGATPGDDNTLDDDLLAPVDTHAMQLYNLAIRFIHDEGVSDAYIVNDGNPATRNFDNFVYHVDETVAGVFTIGAGDNTLTDHSGADVMLGGIGNDTLFASTGDDWLIGGAGDDWLIGGRGDDAINGGGGFDSVDYSRDAAAGGTAAVGVYLSSNIVVDGFGNYDTIATVEDVVGTNVNNAGYNDIIFGTDGSNAIDARGGGDIVVALDGADVIYGGRGTDAIYGGGGADTLVGSDFISAFSGEIDYLISEGGNDTIYVGTAGTAYIDGGSGGDRIYGGSGTDYVLSGSGFDVATLGGGVDLVILYASELVAGDYDTYTDFTDGQDFIYMNASLAGSTTFGNGAGYAYMAIAVAGGTHYTLFNGVTAAQITDQIFFNL